MKCLSRLALMLLILIGFWGSSPTQITLAADSVVFVDIDVKFQFGDSVDFFLSFESNQTPSAVWLLIEPDTLDRMVIEVPFEMEDNAASSLLTLQNLQLKAFSTVDYWYQIEFDSGSLVESDVRRFVYEDDRYQWHAAETDHFMVHWYQGDLNFATKAVNIAESSLVQLTEKFSTTLDYPIELYIYPDSKSLQETLSLGNQDWVAGNASPELNHILVSIAPGIDERLEMERQIPHELTHLFQYQIASSHYQNQPMWLLEGLATNAEVAQNEVYDQVLMDAVKNNALIPLSSLVQSFPEQDNSVYLAYAESASFTSYLQKNFGSDHLQTLLEEYGTGVGYEQGFYNVYHMTAGQMETDWQQTLSGGLPAYLTLVELLPYLLVLVMVAGIPLLMSLFVRLHSRKVTIREQ